jgi:hypothetical protein
VKVLIGPTLDKQLLVHEPSAVYVLYNHFTTVTKLCQRGASLLVHLNGFRIDNRIPAIEEQFPMHLIKVPVAVGSQVLADVPRANDVLCGWKHHSKRVH